MNVTVGEFRFMFNSLVTKRVRLNYSELSEFLNKIKVFESFFRLNANYRHLLKHLISLKLSDEYNELLNKQMNVGLGHLKDRLYNILHCLEDKQNFNWHFSRQFKHLN